MNKKFIAKLLALAMVLAMVPVAFAATSAGSNGGATNGGATNSGATNGGGNHYADTTVVANTTTTVDADDITMENGEAAIEAKVVNGAANVVLTDEAVETLAEQVKGDSLTLVVKTEGATKVTVTMSGKALTALAEKTSASLTVKSEVATITIPNEALATLFKDATTVVISAEITSNGTYSISVLADGKAVTKAIKGLEVKF